MNKNLLLFFFAMAVSFGLNAQIFSEDFESGIPADWSADASWSAGNANSIGSQYFPIPAHGNFVGVNDDAAGNGVSSLGSITTPSIDLSGITAPGVSMSFNAFFVDGDYQGVDEVASVEASSDGGTTWKELLSLPTGSGEWVNHSVNLHRRCALPIHTPGSRSDGPCLFHHLLPVCCNIPGRLLVSVLELSC